MKYVKIRRGKMDSRMAEEYKSLRTNIQFCGADKKVIMLTSCTPNEGKSTTSLQLAISLAELGKRTLLVDADLRRSVLVGKLVVEGGETLGLTHFLSGQAELQDVRYATDVPNLHIINSGPFPPNPAELLSGELFQQAVEAFRDVYDYVIIDTAPLGTVIDAAIVAKVCDGAVMVIEAGGVNYRFVQDTVSQLEKSGCPFLGVILNKVDSKKLEYGRYGKYGKYGKYGGYYGDYYGSSSNSGESGSAKASARPKSQTPPKPKAQAAQKASAPQKAGCRPSGGKRTPAPQNRAGEQK